jgi:hypothetical protein
LVREARLLLTVEILHLILKPLLEAVLVEMGLELLAQLVVQVVVVILLVVREGQEIHLVLLRLKAYLVELLGH